jgi:uncharacterized protein YceK
MLCTVLSDDSRQMEHRGGSALARWHLRRIYDGGTRMRWTRLLFLIAASSLIGCQTARSWSEGCLGVYSGVRYFQDHVSHLPVDEKVFVLLDLPVSAAVDTALLPATIFMRPGPPLHRTAPGCRWATKR